VSTAPPPDLPSALDPRVAEACRALVEPPLESVQELTLGERFLDGIEALLPAGRTGLLLVEPETFEFRLILVRPYTAWAEMDRLALREIDSGTFASAVQERGPSVVDLDREGAPGQVLVLVPVASGDRVLGMGLSLLTREEAPSAAAVRAAEVLATLLAARIEGHGARERANREIAERRKVQEEVDRLNLNLQRSIFKLRHLEKLRDDLTRMIVHDLRTPLTSVKTTLDLMAHGLLGKLVPEELANLSTDRLIWMINDLLDISKIEAGELRPELTDVDLLEVAQAAASALGPLARLERKTIAIEPPPGPTVARADPDLVRRVLENLLGNALRFSPPDSQVTILVRPAAAAEGNLVELAVRDEGEGIPPEYLDRIFQKFVQVEGRKNGKKLGTGLGLTFCRLAAEALGGTIRVESEPGQGSTFTITIPAAAPR
jgi:signal transduction histidine kinase